MGKFHRNFYISERMCSNFLMVVAAELLMGMVVASLVVGQLGRVKAYMDRFQVSGEVSWVVNLQHAEEIPEWPVERNCGNWQQE
jgi:hypothetical protein